MTACLQPSLGPRINFDLRLIFAYAGITAERARVSCFLYGLGGDHPLGPSLGWITLRGRRAWDRVPSLPPDGWLAWAGDSASLWLWNRCPRFTRFLHEIPMRKLTSWLESGGKSPNEQAVKVRLREMLAL